jgi:tetratricopeptide (TPR) repeat protein
MADDQAAGLSKQQIKESRDAQQRGDFDRMLELARSAVELCPAQHGARLRLAESYIYCGQAEAACACLGQLERDAGTDARLLQSIAEMYVHSEAHADAHRCYQRSADLQSDNSDYLYNLATSCVAMGDFDRAEVLFTQVIGLNPADAGAYQNRAMLRTWSADQNHIEELTRALARLVPGSRGEVPLCYALAKELEDLGEYERSFAYLERGAQRRRAMLSYRVETDVEVMERIRGRFDARLLAGAPPAVGPELSLFVLGLPRSGTTLVDRILSSHSRVASIGETNALVFALIRVASGPGGKLGMVERAAQCDFGRLGALYRAGIAGYGRRESYLVNKTPLNYLYLGLIRLALPAARVVHLRRHPLDVCYAMYKTLFRMGYPFSYSLEDIGHYYVAYHELMEHWRTVIPGGFLDVDYESLVNDQELTSRSLLGHCGLEWEEACLAFHRNSAPSATASAVQMRQPIYATSVGKWRLYAPQLEPLRARLEAAGINTN